MVRDGQGNRATSPMINIPCLQMLHGRSTRTTIGGVTVEEGAVGGGDIEVYVYGTPGDEGGVDVSDMRDTTGQQLRHVDRREHVARQGSAR